LSKEAKKEAKMDLDFKYDFTPLFAAGEVYISSIIDTLTSQVNKKFDFVNKLRPFIIHIS
jgi:hypothetical protein